MTTPTDAVPYQDTPCTRCPFAKTTPPDQFPAARYRALAATAGSPGSEADLSAPMFACHKNPEGHEKACAGWLASLGYHHLGVRLAVATGRLPAKVLRPGPGWPELFTSYSEMAAVQAGDGVPDEPHPGPVGPEADQPV